MGSTEFADAVYSSIPASLIGRRQNIEVGQMSGKANVKAKLRQMGLPCGDLALERVLNAAKISAQFLTDEEIKQLASEVA